MAQMEEVTIRIKVNGMITETKYTLPVPAQNAALAAAKAAYGANNVLGMTSSRLVE